MRWRVLLVFLTICLVAIYGINASVTTAHLDKGNVVNLNINAPDTKDLLFDSTDTNDAQTLNDLVIWYNSFKLQSIGLPSAFQGFKQLNWSLKDGNHLVMYAPKQFDGYIFVKDYKLPLVYKFEASYPQALEAYRVFEKKN